MAVSAADLEDLGAVQAAAAAQADDGKIATRIRIYTDIQMHLYICKPSVFLSNIIKNKGSTPLEFFKNFFRAKQNNHPANAGLTGFTLIELLVVIAIIGLLASIIMVSINSVRAKARDTQRMADLTQIQKALEMYYDANGYYPKRDGGTNQYGYTYSDWGSHCGGWWCNLETLLSPYLKTLPRDPNGETQLSRFYIYRSHGNGQSYGISAALEKQSTVTTADGGCRNDYYEIGPSLARCGCAPRPWYELGTDLCP